MSVAARDSYTNFFKVNQDWRAWRELTSVVRASARKTGSTYLTRAVCIQLQVHLLLCALQQCMKIGTTPLIV